MKIFKVTLNGLDEIESKPESSSAAIIVDQDKNRLWIWKGTGASASDLYRASSSATKIKKEFKMFTAKTVIVEEGNEPTDFSIKL